MSNFIFPVPIAYDAIDLSWLIGRAFTEISFLEPTVWRFFLGAPEHISVECLWRILRDERIVRTREDHCQQFGLGTPLDAAQQAMELLSGATITAVHLRAATADISIALSSDLRLEIIPDSSGYESWQLYAPAGQCFVAQGGGQICTWHNEPNQA